MKDVRAIDPLSDGVDGRGPERLRARDDCKVLHVAILAYPCVHHYSATHVGGSCVLRVDRIDFGQEIPRHDTTGGPDASRARRWLVVVRGSAGNKSRRAPSTALGAAGSMPGCGCATTGCGGVACCVPGEVCPTAKVKLPSNKVAVGIRRTRCPRVRSSKAGSL